MKLKVRIDDTVSFFYVLFAIWSLNPYFTWKTYLNGVFGYIGSIPMRSMFALLSCIMGIYYIFRTHKKGKMSKMGIIVMADALILLEICGGVGSDMFNTAWISYIAIAILLFLPTKVQKRTFELFMTLFTVTLIPSLLFYLLDLVGLHLPYSILPSYESIKASAGIYYKHRFLSAQLINPMAIINRFNGIYFEAGILGTVTAMLLGIRKYDFIGKGKWREKILLVSGISSMSIAFILLTLLYFIAKNLQIKKLKNVTILVGIMAAYIIFTTVPLQNPVLTNIQKRITIVDYSLQGDNRTSKGYDRIMEDFYLAPIQTRILGYGKDSFGKIQADRQVDGSSYKSIIYDYGYLGIMLYISWFVVYAVEANRKLKILMSSLLPIVLMQLANIYQNPAVFPIYFVLIFSGGIAEISQEVNLNESTV